MVQDAVDDGACQDGARPRSSDGVDVAVAIVSRDVAFIFGGAVVVFDLFKGGAVLRVPIAELVGVGYSCDHGVEGKIEEEKEHHAWFHDCWLC